MLLYSYIICSLPNCSCSTFRGCVRIAVAKFLRTCIRDSMRPLHLCMDNIIGMLLCILDDDDEEVTADKHLKLKISIKYK